MHLRKEGIKFRVRPDHNRDRYISIIQQHREQDQQILIQYTKDKISLRKEDQKTQKLENT